MSRKATFSPKKPNNNSSAHNSRKEIPGYLLEPDPHFAGNYYRKITPYQDDQQFIELAKKIYNEKFRERTGQNQRMQQKQIESLIWEVAISVEKYHKEEDILALFEMIQREKTSNNYLKMGMIQDSLTPPMKTKKFILPKPLKIKRKQKKENLNETGYHILELSGHYDEGHFIRVGKWDNLAYYPGADILFKDGSWHIKSKELEETHSEDIFDIKANMKEFMKVYNYHWHVKYTNFNLNTGLTASFSKGEVSGQGRLKKVADFLSMKYAPHEKTPFEQSVMSIKRQYHIERQNKYAQLMMKFKQESNIENLEKYISEQEKSLEVKDANLIKKQYTLDAIKKLFISEKTKKKLAEKVKKEYIKEIRIREKKLQKVQSLLPTADETIIPQKIYDIFQNLKKEFAVKNDADLYDKIIQKTNNDKKRINALEDEIKTSDDLLKTEIEELKKREPEKIEIEKIVYKEDATRINELEVLSYTQEQIIEDKEADNQALNDKINILEEASKQSNTLLKTEHEKVKVQKLIVEQKNKELVENQETITALNTQIYSKVSIFNNGKNTGRKFTFKKLSEVRKNKIDALKIEITVLEKKEPEKVEVEKIVYIEDTKRIKDQEIQIIALKTQIKTLNETIDTIPDPSSGIPSSLESETEELGSSTFKPK